MLKIMSEKEKKTMVDGRLLTEKLLRYAKTFLYLNERDEIYFRNILLRELRLTEPAENVGDLSYVDDFDVPDPIVSELEEYATENGIVKEEEKNLFSGYVMGILSPLPSKVNEEFIRLKAEKGIKAACDYLYNLSVKNDYVKKTAIAKNLKWEYVDGKRTLEITVNLSKPEKDNKEIAKLLTQKVATNYPKCRLCKENEGFAGNLTYPARENIRTVSLLLGGEKWFVQYSPYAYYNEHLIAVSEQHVPMHIKEDTVEKVLDFVDFFPNYMIGSNAALPIIGGSILNHEHFQGGGHLMPMHKAGVKEEYKCKEFPSVKVGITDWYNSAIRLVGEKKADVATVAKKIVNEWERFTDIPCGIYAETDGVRHNSCSPIARKDGKNYIVDIILRNNITTKEYPDGVFHAHPEYHNIKKEGIGLIEAMGLFVLPGRLKKQLAMIADILCGETAYDENAIADKENYLYVHRNMIKQLVEKYSCGVITKEQAENVVRDHVNVVCKHILENTAVFKDTADGKSGFGRFMNAFGAVKAN